MSVDFLIILLMWVLGLISFFFITPKNRKRRFLLAFLVCKTIAWVNNLLQVKFNILFFPIKELPKATEVLITTGYFFYPLLCGFYIIFEPKVSLIYRFLYLSVWTSSMTIFEVMLERYTNLIKYIHFEWYWTWVDFFCLFAFSNIFYQWFFRDQTLFKEDKEIVR